MGVVYRAEQLSLGRTVAVKFLLSPISSEQAVRRFRREAESAARLSHPNIVSLYEFCQEGAWLFYSMDYVDGETLQHRIERGIPSAREACRICISVARAVHEAHCSGVLHRDIKPANILLDHDDNVLISDFGLAKTFESEDLTRTEQIVGSPSYMAPEQMDHGGAEVMPATDVYAIGVVLYELLTKRPPFVSSSIHETMNLVKVAAPPRLSLLNRGVSPQLETICNRCLKKDPRKRFRTAKQLGDELERWLNEDISKGYRRWNLDAWMLSRIPGRGLFVLLAGMILGVLFSWNEWSFFEFSDADSPVLQVSSEEKNWMGCLQFPERDLEPFSHPTSSWVRSETLYKIAHDGPGASSEVVPTKLVDLEHFLNERTPRPEDIMGGVSFEFIWLFAVPSGEPTRENYRIHGMPISQSGRIAGKLAIGNARVIGCDYSLLYYCDWETPGAENVVMKEWDVGGFEAGPEVEQFINSRAPRMDGIQAVVSGPAITLWVRKGDQGGSGRFRLRVELLSELSKPSLNRRMNHREILVLGSNDNILYYLELETGGEGGREEGG